MIVDDLAQFIRQVDGDNKMGAGTLADKICERFRVDAPAVQDATPCRCVQCKSCDGNGIVIDWDQYMNPEATGDKGVTPCLDCDGVGRVSAVPAVQGEHYVQTPDWSKAPERATHWCPDTDDHFAAWYREKDGEWEFWLYRNDCPWDRAGNVSDRTLIPLPETE